MGRALIASVCIVAAGCVTSHMQRLDPATRPARDPGSIAVFEQAPDRAYTVIARIELKSNTVFKGFDDLRTQLVDQAAGLGGQAVILGPKSTQTEFISLTTGLILSEKKKLSADVIVFP